MENIISVRMSIKNKNIIAFSKILWTDRIILYSTLYNNIYFINN